LEAVFAPLFNMWDFEEVVGVADERLTGTWAAVLAEVEGRLGSRRAHLAPLAREYVSALREAEEAVTAARANPFVEIKSGRIIEHPGFSSADREARRALAYAQALGLDDPGSLPPDHPLYGLDFEPGEPLDPLDQLDAETQFSGDLVEDAQIRFERRENQRQALKGLK
jgi:hypothetical protein